MPDFVKNFVGENESTVAAWASSVGLPLNVIYLNEGDPGYSASMAAGTVIDQSAKYGTLCSELSSFTITVNGQMISDEDRVPNFVGDTIKNAIAWCNNNGKAYTTNVLSNDVLSNAGKVSTQSVSPGTDKNTISSITFDYYGAVNISETELKAVLGMEDDAAETYLNSIGIYNYQFVDGSSSGGYSCGTIMSVSPTSGTTDTMYTLTIAPHTYDLVETKEAKCTETGLKTYKCKTCDKTYTEEIPALGHSFGDYVVDETSATATRSCSRCDATETIDVPVCDNATSVRSGITCACLYGGEYPACNEQAEEQDVEPE